MAHGAQGDVEENIAQEKGGRGWLGEDISESGGNRGRDEDNEEGPAVEKPAVRRAVDAGGFEDVRQQGAHQGAPQGARDVADDGDALNPHAGEQGGRQVAFRDRIGHAKRGGDADQFARHPVGSRARHTSCIVAWTTAAEQGLRHTCGMPVGVAVPVLYQLIGTVAMFVFTYLLLFHDPEDLIQKPGAIALFGFLLMGVLMLAYYGGHVTRGDGIQPFQYAAAGLLFAIGTVVGVIVVSEARQLLLILVADAIGVVVGLFFGIGLGAITGEVIGQFIFIYIGISLLAFLVLVIFFRLA